VLVPTTSNPVSHNGNDAVNGQALTYHRIHPNDSSEADAGAGVSTPSPINYQGAQPERFVFSILSATSTTR
jgi:hypothetical protein